MKLLLPYTTELTNNNEDKENEEKLLDDLIAEQMKLGIWNGDEKDKKEISKPHVSSENENKAEEIKKEGNIAFVKKDYENAIRLYTDGIQFNPYSEVYF